VAPAGVPAIEDRANVDLAIAGQQNVAQVIAEVRLIAAREGQVVARHRQSESMKCSTPTATM
jgi:hypothetical protein